MAVIYSVVVSGHVFVSYSHHDAAFVGRLKVRLLGAGMQVWTDEGIDGGAEWMSLLERQIETCAVFVPVMSDHSRAAAWVLREIDLAQELGKPIAPLLLGGRRFLSLRNLQDEDVSDGQLPSVAWIQRMRTLTGLPPSAPDPRKPIVFVDGADVPGPLWYSAGQVVAWEENNRKVTVPDGLDDVTAVAAGLNHYLALHSDGHVTAWGGHPLAAIVPDDIRDVTAIAAGMGHNLALHSDGHVSAWGNNEAGQTSVPDGLPNVTAIAAGAWFSVALQRDGQITVWGNRGKPATGLRNVTAVSAGIGHGLALHEDGHVTAWGSGDYGEATVPEGIRDVTKIAAGNLHNLVLHSDGRVAAWGADMYGEATVPDGLSDVIDISAGGHSLALRRGGYVVGWGANGRVTVPDDLRDVTKIVAGTSVSLAIVSKRLK
jgi:hypothetical protein